jgi:hypothetical protein
MPNQITYETRRESYEATLQRVGERHKQCLKGLNELGGTATANELAGHLFNLGLTPHFNRNFVHPRLNELVAMKVVEVIGKRKDEETNRSVAIYKLV